LACVLEYGQDAQPVTKVASAGRTLPWLPVPTLRPFRGLRYDSAATADLSTVICPPYDVIEPAERARLAALDPHNAVRLELPTADGDDSGARYAAAADLFRAWQTAGVLRRDATAMIYVYEQRYRLADAGERIAHSFFCRLRLEDFGPDSGVRPHERTMAAPKEDRFRLLRAVDANLSPVVLLYDDGDSGAASSELLERLTAAPAAALARDAAGISHRLWVIDPESSADARALLALAAARPLTIADGHHRYETALRFRAERAAAAVEPGGADSVLALLYDANLGGLAVLPTHRVVRRVAGAALPAVAQELFEVAARSTAKEIARDLVPGRLGVWTRAGGALLSPRRERVAELLPAGRSETLRWLDVSVLSAALEQLVGMSPARLLDDDLIIFTHDLPEAVARVDSGEADAAFLLPPTPIAAVLSVAAAGEVMPHKSTYFHPKAATGMVFNPLAD
jgi:uncharacterized protein (DUF1015 family)